jgi:hypothetical protein
LVLERRLTIEEVFVRRGPGERPDGSESRGAEVKGIG